jgi:N-methylhydantoinase B
MKVDPITLEVIDSRLREIVSNMEWALYHSAYSPIIRETQDASAVILDRKGELVKAGAAGHSIPFIYSAQQILRRYGYKEINEGDSFIINDPYKGGSPHVPDVVIITPVFYKAELIAFCGSVAHEPDIGGLVPGSSGAGAREIFHEGLLLPGVKYWTKEGVNESIEAILKNNSREPDLIAGDIRAQVGCTKIGLRRLQELCDEYDVETIKQSFDELLNITERRIRNELSKWPNGENDAGAFLDNDGVQLDKPVKIHVNITKRNDELTLDFSGSDEQGKGPINVRRQMVESNSILALTAFIDPRMPLNSGSRRPLKFIVPEGKVVNCAYPAPLSSHMSAGLLIYTSVLAALAKFDPERAVAPPGLGTAPISIGYSKTRAGRRGIQYEIFCTALGGNKYRDGASCVHPMAHRSPNSMIEILETEYPIRVNRVDILIDSAGPGKNRGGLGYSKEYELLEDCTFNIRSSQDKHGGGGIFGGKGGKLPSCTVNPGTSCERLLKNMETREVKRGEVIRIERTGGGGYGDPFEREAERVLEDVLNGYVSIQKARTDYGVVIDPENLKIDHEATLEERKTKERRISR